MKISVKFIADSAIIAALYAVLTWAFAPISYGPVQFRISEVLVLLVVLNPKYSVALVLGCFIANTTSSLGWYDMVFGTLATLIAVIPMCFIRKMPIAALFPVISNAFIVSLELGLAFELWGASFWYDVWTVGLGEIVVIYGLGIAVMTALAKNQKVVELLELEKEYALDIKGLTMYKVFAIVLSVLGIILFVAYPMNPDTSMFTLTTLGMPYLWVMPVIGLAYGVVYLFTKDKIRLISTIAVALLLLVPYILVGVLSNGAVAYTYFYVFMFYPILLIVLPILDFIFTKKNEKTEELNRIELDLEENN